jgi:hypothetical protein
MHLSPPAEPGRAVYLRKSKPAIEAQRKPERNGLEGQPSTWLRVYAEGQAQYCPGLHFKF